MDQLKISSQYINKRCGLHLDEYQQLDPGGSNRLGIIDGKGKFIACHNHKHITRKEYNEIIPKIIEEFLENGFKEVLNYFEKEIDILKEYEDLKKEFINENKISARKTSKSNSIIRKYMPHVYDVKDYKENNIQIFWTKDKLEKAFKSLDKPNATVNSQLSELLRVLKLSRLIKYTFI